MNYGSGIVNNNLDKINMNQMVNSGNKKRIPKKSKDLGKDEFLRLLITQLSHQDPLKPMEDKEFIAQMAQFSSLEQMMQIKKNLADMKKSFVLNQTFEFLGKKVRVVNGKSGKSDVGIVTEISTGNGTSPKLKVNGKFYEMKDVMGIVLDEGKKIDADKISDKKINKDEVK